MPLPEAGQQHCVNPRMEWALRLCVLGHRSMDVPKKVPFMAVALVLHEYLKQGLVGACRGDSIEPKGCRQAVSFTMPSNFNIFVAALLAISSLFQHQQSSC